MLYSATFGRSLVLGLLVAVAPATWAQQSAPAASSRESPRPEELEPGVNTSDTASKSREAIAPPKATEVKPDPAAAPHADAAPSPDRNKADAAQKTHPAHTNGKEAPAAGTPPGKAQDRLELDTTTITGNRELPKVLYIVPWKRSDLGDLVGKPANSLIDEVLAPVDRDVFKRENRYYEALKPDAARPSGPPAGAAQGSGDKP